MKETRQIKNSKELDKIIGVLLPKSNSKNNEKQIFKKKHTK